VLAAALAAFAVLQALQRASMSDLFASETAERSRLLAQVIELSGRALSDFTGDYAQWDDMVAFAGRPDAAWAAINIEASFEKFGLHGVWVLREDGSVAYATRGPQGGPPPALPVADPVLRRLFTIPAGPSAFVRTDEGLVELRAAPIQPSADTERRSPARGWLLAARIWDAAQLGLLAGFVQGEVSVAAPGGPAGRTRGPHEIVLRHALSGPDRTPVADLVFTVRSDELAIVARHQRAERWLFAGTGLFAAGFALVFIYRRVLAPLRLIGTSLARGTADEIRPLLSRPDELGHVAQLVQTAFAQRTELETMLGERARLGRELHDGVIQTVYAAGMNLAGARAAIRTQPEEAERVLDETHAALNGTIRELRAFIDGLEPEARETRTFREAVQAILSLMQGVRAIEWTAEIDEALAARLSSGQRLHVLQIVREAASNCVRHSNARTLRVALQPESALAVLTVADDGQGLDEAHRGDEGRGLGNLAARARELGGRLSIDSQRGAGLRLRLSFLPDRDEPGEAP
jgi:signal transduction histidine kinase